MDQHDTINHPTTPGKSVLRRIRGHRAPIAVGSLGSAHLTLIGLKLAGVINSPWWLLALPALLPVACLFVGLLAFLRIANICKID